ncbi:MAG: guanylate kinase [Planctomycetia bacterium]
MSANPTPGRSNGLLVVVSGPSGSGKSTLVRRLLEQQTHPLVFSVSATSRPARDGEVDGIHYTFLSREEFERRRAAGDLLEHADVHGNLYGTPRAPVEAALAAGRWMLLEIDCEGYRQVKQAIPDAVGFFIRAPSTEAYAERLLARKSETPETLARRLADARAQLDQAVAYDFQVVNESVEQAFRTFETLLIGVEHQRGLANARRTA